MSATQSLRAIGAVATALTLTACAVSPLPSVNVGTRATVFTSASIVGFTVRNEGSKTIYYVYTSESSELYWGDDMLGEYGIIAPRQSVTFPLDISSYCYHDFLIVYQDESTDEVYGVDACDRPELTIR